MARGPAFDRDEILTRARDLFWKKGFHATSLKDLEAALDLKPGSIYAAFGSKEGLYAEALETYARASRAEAAETMSGAGSPLAGLAAHARALGRLPVRGLPSNACMLVKTVLEFPDGDSRLRQTAERLLAETEAGFAEQFRRAQEAGEIVEDADPERLGRRFQADVIGLRAYAQRSGSAEATLELAEDIARGLEALAVR